MSMGSSESRKKRKGISSSKAAEILHDGTAQGHKLTDRQRRFMAAKAYGGKRGRKN